MASAYRQAIAALNRAMATDPNNAEVLLSLGVSYTNELDQGRALNFLTAWLSRQPAFTKVRPGPFGSVKENLQSRFLPSTLLCHRQMP